MQYIEHYISGIEAFCYTRCQNETMLILCAKQRCYSEICNVVFSISLAYGFLGVLELKIPAPFMTG